MGPLRTLTLLLAISSLVPLTQGCAVLHHLGHPLAVDELSDDELARRGSRGARLVVRDWRQRSRCP